MKPSSMDYKIAKERLEATGLYVREQSGFYSHFLRVRNGPPSPENETIATLDIEDGEVAGATVESLIWNKKRSDKEFLIFIRGKWEIAHEKIGFGTGRKRWIRRDQSWICDVGAEEAIMPMPPKPKKQNGNDSQ